MAWDGEVVHVVLGLLGFCGSAIRNWAKSLVEQLLKASVEQWAEAPVSMYDGSLEVMSATQIQKKISSKRFC